MLKSGKQLVKGILDLLNIQVTKNQKYDRQTKEIMRLVLNEKSNCIDIGCHKGEVMDIILSFAPNGHHYGFEPIPYMFKGLQEKYGNHKNIRLFDCALSNQAGVSKFNVVKDDPAYSGIKQRAYKTENPEIEIIEVQLKPLDELIPETEQIQLIKIDVEGAELGVLQGAKKLLTRCKPTLVFEHGKGASEFYGTKPEMVYQEITDCALKINTLDGYLKKKPALTQSQFQEQYNKAINYYFVAYA